MYQLFEEMDIQDNQRLRTFLGELSISYKDYFKPAAPAPVHEDFGTIRRVNPALTQQLAESIPDEQGTLPQNSTAKYLQTRWKLKLSK